MAAAQLENLVRIGQLRREGPVADELAGLKRSAQSRLADATRPDLSFASRFDLAYNAAHALRTVGLRTEKLPRCSRSRRSQGQDSSLVELHWPTHHLIGYAPLTVAFVLLYGSEHSFDRLAAADETHEPRHPQLPVHSGLSLDLDETTVLIGENNTGKTAVLDAVRICLERLRGRGRRQFDEYDYHLASSDASPTDAEPIEVRLSFMESEAEPWAEEVGQALVDVAPLGPDDRRQVTLRVSSQFDSSINDFTTDWSFLDASGEALPGTARSGRLLNTLQDLVPVFYLSALRDASRHFTPSGRFWRSFLGELGLPEDQRQDLQAELAKLNDRLIKAHGPLAKVRGELEDAKRVVDFGAAQAVTVEALPTKLFALLSRAQVQLASRSGARIPVAEQGEGTQSLAVLLLFGAFLRSQLSGLDPNASAITALEEPEAHLHPSATRALMQLVDELPGQKLISTHSGHMLASVPATAIRRLAYEGGDIKAYRIDGNSLTDEEKRKFDFHVRRSRGELLFARCWLLVEGETEVVLLAGAAEARGLNLERDGVCCVEYSQTNVGVLAKIANQLGIPWYCVMDNDEGRKKYERGVRAQIRPR